MRNPNKRTVKIGMIGVGGWGTVGHLNAYRESQRGAHRPEEVA